MQIVRHNIYNICDQTYSIQGFRFRATVRNIYPQISFCQIRSFRADERTIRSFFCPGSSESVSFSCPGFLSICWHLFHTVTYYQSRTLHSLISSFLSVYIGIYLARPILAKCTQILQILLGGRLSRYFVLVCIWKIPCVKPECERYQKTALPRATRRSIQSTNCSHPSTHSQSNTDSERARVRARIREMDRCDRESEHECVCR